MWGISPMEMLVVGAIALLIFGKRLPEVARSLGKGIVEFKKGVKGIEDEVDKPLPYNPNQYSPPYGQQQAPAPQGQYQYPTYGQPPAGTTPQSPAAYSPTAYGAPS